MSGAFYGLREFTLVRSTDPGVFRIDDLCLAGNEAADKADLFIIDEVQVLGTKKALYGHRH